MEHELDSRASVLRTPYLESRDDSSMRDSEEKPKSGYSGVSMENFSGFFFFFSQSSRPQIGEMAVGRLISCSVHPNLLLFCAWFFSCCIFLPEGTFVPSQRYPSRDELCPGDTPYCA